MRETLFFTLIFIIQSRSLTHLQQHILSIRSSLRTSKLPAFSLHFHFLIFFRIILFSILFLITGIYKSNTECNQFYQYAIHSATIEVMTSSRLFRLHNCIDTATKLLIPPPMDELDDAVSRTFFDFRFKSKSHTSHVLVMQCNVGCCM